MGIHECVGAVEEEAERIDGPLRPYEIEAEVLGATVRENIGESSCVHALDELGGVDGVIQDGEHLRRPGVEIIEVLDGCVEPRAKLGVVDAWFKGGGSNGRIEPKKP